MTSHNSHVPTHGRSTRNHQYYNSYASSSILYPSNVQRIGQPSPKADGAEVQPALPHSFDRTNTSAYSSLQSTQSIFGSSDRTSSTAGAAAYSSATPATNIRTTPFPAVYAYPNTGSYRSLNERPTWSTLASALTPRDPPADSGQSLDTRRPSSLIAHHQDATSHSSSLGPVPSSSKSQPAPTSHTSETSADPDKRLYKPRQHPARASRYKEIPPERMHRYRIDNTTGSSSSTRTARPSRNSGADTKATTSVQNSVLEDRRTPIADSSRLEESSRRAEEKKNKEADRQQAYRDALTNAYDILRTAVYSGTDKSKSDSARSERGKQQLMRDAAERIRKSEEEKSALQEEIRELKMVVNHRTAQVVDLIAQVTSLRQSASGNSYATQYEFQGGPGQAEKFD